MKNRLTCIIERTLPSGKVLVAVASRNANPAYYTPNKPKPLLLSSKQEFAAADREAIEAYKEELYANADDSESSCPPVGNGKRKNNAHLANPM